MLYSSGGKTQSTTLDISFFRNYVSQLRSSSTLIQRFNSRGNSSSEGTLYDQNLFVRFISSWSNNRPPNIVIFYSTHDTHISDFDGVFFGLRTDASDNDWNWFTIRSSGIHSPALVYTHVATLSFPIFFSLWSVVFVAGNRASCTKPRWW